MDFSLGLKILNLFTNTALVQKSETYFTDSALSFFGKLKFDSISDEDVGFYENISDFQRILSLFENPTIEKTENVLNLSEDGISAKFVTSDVRLISQQQNPEQIKTAIEKTLEVQTAIQFEISETTFAQIKKALSAIPNARIVIKTDENLVKLIVKPTDVFQSVTNSVTLKIPAVVNRPCSIEMQADNFVKMPSKSFNVDLKFSEKSALFRCVLQDANCTLVIPTAHTE